MSYLLCVLLLSVLVSVLVSPVQAVTYYVAKTGSDSVSCGAAGGDGTGAQNINTPRQTVVKGIECIRNQGGDILYIRAGTYDQSIDTPTVSGTSDLNRNMIAGYPGETVIIKNTGGSCTLCLRYPSATRKHKYLIFDNLIFDATGGGSVYIQKTTDGSIGHNIFRNGEIRFSPKSDGISGLNAFDEIHHMKIHSNGLLQTSGNQAHGIYACAHDVRIHDNEFYHNSAYGMQFYSANGPADCSSRSKFWNNKFYDNVVTTKAQNPQSHSAGGMNICCGDSAEIYNNMFYSNGHTAGGEVGHGLQLIIPGTNYRVCNNTFWYNSGIGMVIPAGQSPIEFTNNILWQNATNYDDKSGNNTPMDTSNLVADPKFIDAIAGDLTPNLTPGTGSPAINTGTPNHVVTDALGKPRPSGAKIDKGAIEVQQGGGGGGPGPGTGPGTFYTDLTVASGDTVNDCNAAKNPLTPKQTITGVKGGLSCVAAAGAGSTLRVKAGVYNEKIDTNDLPALPGGTDWDHATTIAAFESDVVTLQIPITGSGARVGIFFRDAVNSHYFIIDRIHIDGAGGQYTNGFVCFPGTHHIRYQNAEIKNVWYEPVLIKDAVGCEILNNSLHDWLNLSGIHAHMGVSDTIIRGNSIFNGPGSGIKMDANENAEAISNALIEQNTIFQVGTTSSLAAMLLGGTGNTNLMVRNNLAYNSYRGIEIVTGTPSAKILNNTVYGMATTGIQVDGGALNTAVRNNISYGNSGTAIGDASGSMIPQTNLITDPSFLDAGSANFQLQSVSAAINQGTNLPTEVPMDFLGVTRSQYGVTDIGAYEFTGTISTGGDVLGPRRIGGAPQDRGMFEQR